VVRVGGGPGQGKGVPEEVGIQAVRGHLLDQDEQGGARAQPESGGRRDASEDQGKRRRLAEPELIQ